MLKNLLIILVVCFGIYYYKIKFLDEKSANLGIYLYYQGKYKEALEEFTKELKLNPQNVDLLNNRGQVYLQLEDYNRALLDFSNGIKFNPQIASLYFNRGNLFFQMESYVEAEKDLTKCITLDPNFSQAYVNRGNLYSVQGKFKEAIEDFTKVIQAEAPNAGLLIDAYYNRGNIYLTQKHFFKALDDFSKCLELNPNLHSALNNRANTFMQLEQYEHALNDYNKAIIIGKDLSVLFNSRGKCYSKMGKSVEAMTDFIESLRIEENANAYLYRGIELAKLGNLHEAREDFKLSITMDSTQHEAYFNRGAVLLELYKREKKKEHLEFAVNDFSRSLQLFPDSGRTYAYRAIVYDKLGRERERNFDIQKAKKLDPSMESEIEKLTKEYSS